MSWHCGFCGGTEKCNAQITIYDIRGMVPMHLVCCLECVTKVIPKESSAREELEIICKELDERIEKEEKSEFVYGDDYQTIDIDKHRKFNQESRSSKDDKTV